MSAAISSRVTAQKTFGVGVCGLAALALIFSGCMLCYDADGFIVDGADTAGLRFAGVSRSDEDNTAGADGDVKATFFREGVFQFATSGLTAADVGKKVYLIDNQTVGLITHASVDQDIYVGTIAEYVSATSCYVAIDPIHTAAVTSRDARSRSSSHNVETLAANKDLVVTDAELQKLDPGGANRNVALPTEANAPGLRFRITNAADAAENLVVKNQAGTTIGTLNQNEAASFYCDGTSWAHDGIQTIALT